MEAACVEDLGIYYMNLGLCYYYSHDRISALPNFTTCIEKIKDNKNVEALAYHFRAACYAYNDQVEECASDEAMVTKLNPNLKMKFHFRLLPPEMLIVISKFLHYKQVPKIRLVSKEFDEVLKHSKRVVKQD